VTEVRVRRILVSIRTHEPKAKNRTVRFGPWNLKRRGAPIVNTAWRPTFLYPAPKPERPVFKPLAIAVLSLLTVGADDPKKVELTDAARKELKSLEGEWVVQKIETKSEKHEPGDADRLVLTIKGTTWTFGTLQEGEVVALDPSTDPKLLDLKSTRKNGETAVNEAVYKVTGDTMLISIYQGKDKKRPTNLDVPTEGETVLWTLKKAKK
jgi:uncharacterized protein (TIGR03067 family)